MKKKLFNFTFVVALLTLSTKVVYADELTTEYIMCGNTSFPAPFASIFRTTFAILQIVVPISIIIMGSLDMVRSVIAQDNEKIAKARRKFITRLIAGAITFFVFVIVKFAVGLFADEEDGKSFGDCLNCLINDEASCKGTSDSPFQDPDDYSK